MSAMNEPREDERAGDDARLTSACLPILEETTELTENDWETLVNRFSREGMTTSNEVACPLCKGPTRPGVAPCYHCRELVRSRETALRWARLTPLKSADLWQSTPSKPLAMLHGLAISHSGRGYWVVHGRVPLAVARELYADPVGRDVIRVAGHGLGPPPEAPWVEWFMPNGRKVLPIKERRQCEECLASARSKLVQNICRGILEDCDFSDDPAGAGASGFVTLYHIDGDIGLRVFVDIFNKKSPPTRAKAAKPVNAVTIADPCGEHGCRHYNLHTMTCDQRTCRAWVEMHCR